MGLVIRRKPAVPVLAVPKKAKPDPTGSLVTFLRALSDAAPSESVDAWLGEYPETDRRCCLCGNGPMRRWEALNKKCASCLAKWEEARGEATKRENPLAAAGVPVRYQDYSVESFAKSWKRGVPVPVLDWARSPAEVLVLVGGAGTGKTWAAVAALKVALEGGKWGRFEDAAELVGKILDESRYGSRESRDRCGRCKALVLDDLGVEREGAAGILEELVRARYNAGLGTLVTTNVPESAWWERDPSFARRIFEERPVEMPL